MILNDMASDIGLSSHLQGFDHVGIVGMWHNYLDRETKFCFLSLTEIKTIFYGAI